MAKTVAEKKEEAAKRKKLEALETDASVAADKAMAAEQDLAEQIKERQEVEETPDMPSMLPKRWGENRRLTFATPGTLQRDPFYIPEFVETNTGARRRVSTHRHINGQLHILTPDCRAKYRWTNTGKIGIQKRYGFRFATYDGLFGGTGLFERKDGDTIWNGDVVLMFIPMAAWEKKRDETEEMKNYMEGGYGSQFFQHAQDSGTPSFQDDMGRGVREFMT